MPFLQAGGLTVQVDISGPADAPPIVFVHSLGTNLHLWDPQVAQLCKRYRVIRYDLRGHGLTSLAPAGEDYAMSRLADDVAALLDALRVERAHYVGLSIGGLIGQRFAAAYPERVEALVLAATGSVNGTPESWNARIEAVKRGGMTAIVDTVMERWFAPATRAERPIMVDGFRIMVERTPVAGYIGCCAAIAEADLRADDARIAARTLILAGETDPSASPAVAAAMRDLIPGARLEVIPAASHLLNVEQPDAFTALVDGFLSASAVGGVR